MPLNVTNAYFQITATISQSVLRVVHYTFELGSMRATSKIYFIQQYFLNVQKIKKKLLKNNKKRNILEGVFRG